MENLSKALACLCFGSLTAALHSCFCFALLAWRASLPPIRRFHAFVIRHTVTNSPSTSRLVKGQTRFRTFTGRGVNHSGFFGGVGGKCESAWRFLVLTGSELGSVDFTHFLLGFLSRGRDSDKRRRAGKGARSSSAGTAK